MENSTATLWCTCKKKISNERNWKKPKSSASRFLFGQNPNLKNICILFAENARSSALKELEGNENSLRRDVRS